MKAVDYIRKNMDSFNISHVSRRTGISSHKIRRIIFTGKSSESEAKALSNFFVSLGVERKNVEEGEE